MFIIPLIFSLLWTVAFLVPGPVRAQSGATAVEEAIVFYQQGQPADAAQRLNDLLASPDTVSLDRKTRALGQTYLGLSYLAMGRPVEAQESVERAILTEVSVVVEQARAWGATGRAMLDSAAAHVVAESVDLYDDAQYERAVEQLHTVVPLDGIVGRATAASIHKYLAFNYVAMGRQDLARREFQTALRVDPKLTLGEDAVIAPKLRRLFVAIRREAITRSRESTLRNTILRSLLVPGWGQVYQGQRIKGYGFIIAQTGLVAGMVFAIRSFNTARDAYVRFNSDEALALYNRRRSLEDVNEALRVRYDRYASSARRANVLIGLSAGVWGLNLIDALLVSRGRESVGLSGTSDDRPPRVAVTGNALMQQWTVQYQMIW